ncbi:nitrogen permease regulator 2-domain-containing protein [Entophlyctis helioformis]|nr:nitrogen permease regulator 2-domain-containing protein [Entophlyctis helioformis]
MEGFPLVLAIFYAEFHPVQGPKVVFEVPEGFVQSSMAGGGGGGGGAGAGGGSLSASTLLSPDSLTLGLQTFTPLAPTPTLPSAAAAPPAATATATTTAAPARTPYPEASAADAAAIDGRESALSFLLTGPLSVSLAVTDSLTPTPAPPTPLETLADGPALASSPAASPSRAATAAAAATTTDPVLSGPAPIAPATSSTPGSASGPGSVAASGGLAQSAAQTGQTEPAGLLAVQPPMSRTLSGASGSHAISELPSIRASTPLATAAPTTLMSSLSHSSMQPVQAYPQPGLHPLPFNRPAVISTADLQDPSLDFDAISEYIIPKSHLCNRLVTLSTTHYKVVGHPVLLENTKYERNALLFNLCFVFERGAITACYEQVVCKMARVLKSLEVESEFLHNATTKASILNIIEQLLEDLNSYNECQIPINDANMINVKLFPQYPTPAPVFDCQVPVAMLDLKAIMDKHWDLTMRRVIPFIDGVNSVRRIGVLADVNIALVRLAIQHLLYYGCVRLIDIFQFSNTYNVMSSVATMLSSEESQMDCIQFVRKPNMPMPSFGAVFALYCSLKGGLKLSEWIQDNRSAALALIDIRRFIAYGILKGFVYRVHQYPVLTLKSTDGALMAADPSLSRISSLLNGQHHFDDLCTRLQCTRADLEHRLSQFGTYYILK